VLGVVGGVADEEHEPVARDLGRLQAGPDQRPTDPLAAAGRVDRERAQQQRGPVAEPHRPVPDGAQEPALAVRRDEAQPRHGIDPGAVPVRNLAVPVGAEREVQEALDLGPVLGPLGNDAEHVDLGARGERSREGVLPPRARGRGDGGPKGRRVVVGWRRRGPPSGRARSAWRGHR
jgi:hypothetical protein